jgi:hypothetical protein
MNVRQGGKCVCGPLQNIAHFIVIDLATNTMHLSSLSYTKINKLDDSQLVMFFDRGVIRAIGVVS